jgi:hypothetical protein
VHSLDNLNGIVALTGRRLIVSHFADGVLYRIDLDGAGGRTIVPITGVRVPLAAGMALDGDRLVIADDAGLSVVELGDDAGNAGLVEQIRDPSFRDTAAVAAADDRNLVVNLNQSSSHKTPGQLDTVSGVPARHQVSHALHRARRTACPSATPSPTPGAPGRPTEPGNPGPPASTGTSPTG